jgi:hypothetical protein
MMATVAAADLPARRAASTVDRDAINGLALLEDQDGPGPPADQEVTLPGTGLAAPVDALGPVVEGAPPGDGATRLPRPTAAPPGAAARQQLPQLLGLLRYPVDEGVDGLGGDGAQPAFLAPPQPARNLLRRPALEQALADEAAEPRVALEHGRPLAALEVAALGMHRQVAALGQRVAPQLAADGRGRPAELGRDRPQAEPLGLQRGQPVPLLQAQMRPACHRTIPDFGSWPERYHNAPYEGQKPGHSSGR